jgi:imidazolonepropionase-like amidohydrolase
MDVAWAFRSAYSKAQSIKLAQDAYCAKAQAGEWEGLGKFPRELQWEALVEVLRGRVKVQTHCYEPVDLDQLVRVSVIWLEFTFVILIPVQLSNEFEFPIAAVHHASSAYLVPSLLTKAYGPAPGIALFSTQGRYKREAYRASPFAPRVLASHNLRVAMKSDHPVMHSRYLLFEAQQAFYYGMPWGLALKSVTSTPAELLGVDHRVGYLKDGWDADLVVWDSHPLALGATPKQVYIDGIPQLKKPHVVAKPALLQTAPTPPNFDKEAEEAVKYEGLPPLAPAKSSKGDVLFVNVSEVYRKEGGAVVQAFSGPPGTVLVRNGEVICMGSQDICFAQLTSSGEDVDTIDLKGGAISPGLTSFGAPLGLEAIQGEPSTNDGDVIDPVLRVVPRMIEDSLIRAVDGLQFQSRDALYVMSLSHLYV